MMAKYTRILFTLVFLSHLSSYANDFDWCFIENKGQFDHKINFSHAIPNGNIFLEKGKLTYHLFDSEAYHEAFEEKNREAMIKHHAFEVNFAGANQSATVEQFESTDHYFNFFVGEKSANWAPEVYGYHKIKYKEIYKGIDFVMHDQNHRIKYDFIVKAGANTNQIKLKYKGLDNIYIDSEGRLHLVNTINEIVEDKPYVYQNINGKQVEVKSAYQLVNKTLSFTFPEGYDKNYDLIIDPTLIFSSYSGSTNLYSANCSAFDQAGNLYSAGGSLFGGFPTTVGAYQTAFVGGGLLGAVQKFDQAGNMLYATYIGGDNDYPLDVIVNQNDELVILVNSNGSFPMTAGAADGTFNGTLDYAIGILNNAGTALVASTYLGGTADEGIGDSDLGAGLFVDANNDIFVCGMTQSADFPSTAGAYQTALQGLQSGILSKFNANLTTMIWSTYLGGTTGDDIVNSVSVAPNGNIYVVGSTASADFPVTPGALNTLPAGLRDGFVSCLSPTGAALNFSSYLGTGANDRAKFVEINDANEIFVGGSTRGAYPVSGGAYSSPSTNNLFVHKLTTDLSTTLFSTAIGCFDVAQPEIYMTAFGIDYCDKVYFTGASTGNNFPTTANAYTAAEKGLYMCVLEPDAVALNYGSYFGGDVNGQHFHVGSRCKYNREGILFHTECTTASDYPLVNGLNYLAGGLNDGASFIFDFEFSLPINQIDLGASPMTTCTFPVNLDATVLANTALPANENVQYLWSTGATTDNIDVNTPDTYSVQVYNTCDTIYDTIVINSGVLDAEFSVDNPAVCQDANITFADQTVIVGGNPSWLWDFGDNNNSTEQNPEHVYTVAGTYTVTLTVTNNGCSDTETQDVTVSPIPEANFDFTPQHLTSENGEINFTNLSEGADGYLWNFGLSFGVSVLDDPTFTFPTDETELVYPITLQASNNFGCTHEVTKYLEFQDVIVFYVPNAFTPGATGPNTTFSPVMTSGVEPYQYHLILYDRWGEIVFESFNYDIGWDGTYDGKVVQPGVYIWKIQFRETMSDKKHTKIGHVSVIR